ncbi:MAG: hypothetical protein WA987_14965 [Cellvibrio sp.]|jgi:hypothetical protein
MSAITQLTSTVNALRLKFTNNEHALHTASQAAATINAGPSNPARHHGWDHFLPKVEANPEFAKTMAKDVAFIPDKLLVNLNEAPPLNDAEAWRRWTNQSVEFDNTAAKVTEQRIEIYNDMKLHGSTDAEIFKALIEFNHSLPMDYQIKSGLIKLNAYA